MGANDSCCRAAALSYLAAITLSIIGWANEPVGFFD